LIITLAAVVFLLLTAGFWLPILAELFGVIFRIGLPILFVLGVIVILAAL
jgi:hypothetical protein